MYILGTWLLFAIGYKHFYVQLNVLPKIREANSPPQDSNEGWWVTNVCWKFEEDLTFHTTWTMIINIDASKRQDYLTPPATTTASDGSFLAFSYKYVWILNNSSIYVDSLATAWKNIKYCEPIAITTPPARSIGLIPMEKL